MQAAHLLPGQIKIDGAFPWLFLSGPAARRLESLFGHVEPLRADFNKADSAAEANGLTEAFANACRQVLTGKGEDGGGDRRAYDQDLATRARLRPSRRPKRRSAASRRAPPLVASPSAWTTTCS
jgi:hypothetical protein